MKTDIEPEIHVQTHPLTDPEANEQVSNATSGDRQYDIRSNYHLSTLTTRSEWVEMMESWDELAQRADQSIYMSPEWTLSWWDHFGENSDRTLQIVTVKAADQLVAILPFYKGVSRLGRRIVEERLQLIGSGGHPNERLGYVDDYGISDFLDILVDPDFHEPMAELIVSLLRSPEYSVCRTTFHQAREDSFVVRHLLPLLETIGRPVTVETTDTCPIIELSDTLSLQAYIKKQKSNARRRLRQAMKAPSEHPDYQIGTPDSDETLDSMLEELIRLHQERWNQLGFPGVFHNPRFRAFFFDITHQLYDRNRIWIEQARDREGVVALRMAMRYNNRYYDYMSGFDSNSASASCRPGIGLLLNLVEHSLENDIDRIELLRGEEPYKFDFTQKTIQNHRITIEPVPPVGIVGKGLRALIHSLAWGYTHARKEGTLMAIQRETSGLPGMVPGYVRFRYHSLKKKLNRENAS